MPELPEVEVVRRGLDDCVVGRRIEVVRFLGGRVARRHHGGPVDLARRLRGTVILAACRRGKYLWLVLEAPDGRCHGLVIHLGMSGQLLIKAAGEPRERHLHATFDFADDGPQLRFVDQRTFGSMALADLVDDPWSPPQRWGVPASVTHIASDPGEPSFDQRSVITRLKLRHTALKAALLDQGLISGIGNIYADEALWRAQIHGERECAALSKPALGRLVDHARAVMLEATALGGTSFDALYVNVHGEGGFFTSALAVYGRAGRPCSRCGTLIERAAFMGRSSYFCPRCQPRPRPGRGRRR